MKRFSYPKFTFLVVLGMMLFVGSSSFFSQDMLANSSSLLPISNQVNKNIATYTRLDYETDKGVLLAVTSLQGLVNRTSPRIYIKQDYGDNVRDNQWMLDLYIQKGYVETVMDYTDVYALIDAYKREISGAVVIDPDKDYTVNIATNIAGVENRIIITPEMVPSIQAKGITDIKDLKDNNFASAYEAYVWVYNTYYSQQNQDVLSVTYYEKAHDFHRDYLIQHKIHTFWLPGVSDPDYDTNLTNHIKYVMHHADANIPVLGFWHAVDSSGNARGIGEYAGVKLAGQYGKLTVVDDHVSNYSFHSGIRVDESKFRQTETRQKDFAAYDPSKKYVAVTMIESGDAPAYFGYGYKYHQIDSERGTVPFNVSITPTLKYLMPGILEWIYETSSESEFYFGSISGDGYTYPLDGYGEYGVLDTQHQIVMNQTQIMNEYFVNSYGHLKTLDMDMMGIYSHPFSAWQSGDDAIVNQFMVNNMERVSSILSDMGRNSGTTGANANRQLEQNVSIHHCLTRWSVDNYYAPYDTSKDQDAVNWLVNEIKTNAAGTNFIHAMAYSWHYGPRRLKMVQDALASEGYVFVTLNEFEHLYRVANNLDLIPRDPYNYVSTKIQGAAVEVSSSFASAYDGQKAVDGLKETDWATTNAGKNDGWIKLTWAHAQNVNKIELFDRVNTNDHVLKGKLEFSDGSSIDLPQLNNNGNVYVVEFPTRSITWVKYSIMEISGSTYASGLSEMAVYNTPKPVYYSHGSSIGNTNLATNKAVTTSGVWQNSPDFVGDFAIDSKDTTRWASNTSGAIWITIDLGSIYWISTVDTFWEAAGSYEIQVSSDNSQFSSVATDTATTGGRKSNTFNTVSCRYVKISAPSYRSIWDIAIME